MRRSSTLTGCAELSRTIPVASDVRERMGVGTGPNPLWFRGEDPGVIVSESEAVDSVCVDACVDVDVYVCALVCVVPGGGVDLRGGTVLVWGAGGAGGRVGSDSWTGRTGITDCSGIFMPGVTEGFFSATLPSGDT